MICKYKLVKIYNKIQNKIYNKIYNKIKYGEQINYKINKHNNLQYSNNKINFSHNHN